jgi:hypothetical protein
MSDAERCPDCEWVDVPTWSEPTRRLRSSTCSACAGATLRIAMSATQAQQDGLRTAVRMLQDLNASDACRQSEQRVREAVAVWAWERHRDRRCGPVWRPWWALLAPGRVGVRRCRYCPRRYVWDRGWHPLLTAAQVADLERQLLP